MKKIILTCFYLLLTLGVSLTGFILPSALSAYQDEQTASTIEHPAVEAMQLTYSSSFVETLRLLSDCYFVNYPLTGSRRTVEEVYQIALDAAKQIKKYKLSDLDLSEEDTAHSIKLELAIAIGENISDVISDDDGNSFSAKEDARTAVENSTVKLSASDSEDSGQEENTDITTAVVWDCTLYSEYGYWIDFKIDDKSGKIVGLYMFTPQTASVSAGYTDPDQFVSRCAKFMQKIYEVPARVQSEHAINAVSDIYDGQYSVLEAHYVIHLEDQAAGFLFDIPLALETGSLYINVVPKG